MLWGSTHEREIKRRPTPVEVRFGHRMRARRMMLGLTQSELGAALDVTFKMMALGGTRLLS
jgi:DNA-binding XRE family transcriptional regulator